MKDLGLVGFHARPHAGSQNNYGNIVLHSFNLLFFLVTLISDYSPNNVV